MSLPTLRNPFTRARLWVRNNRAQAEIAAIAAVALGGILVMLVVTLVVIYASLR